MMKKNNSFQRRPENNTILVGKLLFGQALSKVIRLSCLTTVQTNHNSYKCVEYKEHEESVPDSSCSLYL